MDQSVVFFILNMILIIIGSGSLAYHIGWMQGYKKCFEDLERIDKAFFADFDQIKETNNGEEMDG